MLKKNKLKVLMLISMSASLYSVNVNAAQVWKGVETAPTSYVLLEAGGSYTHAFYKDSFTPAETHNVLTPDGFSINPGNFYPTNFYGGYIGVSFLKCNMLYNIRYDMYGSKSKTSFDTTTKFAPAKLSFTADGVWGDINTFSYGAGAGVVIATINYGYTRTTTAHTLPDGQILNPVLGESIQGRARIDPLIEVFGMYRLGQNVNVRLNVAYQIPVNHTFTNGSINTNLGLNYALPV